MSQGVRSDLTRVVMVGQSPAADREEAPSVAT